MKNGLGVGGLNIEVLLMGNIYNSESIVYFDMSIGINSIPRGTIQVFHTGLSDVKIQSGEIGYFTIYGTEHSDLNATTFAFVVNEANMTNDAGATNNKLAISFTLGIMETFETKTLSQTGTSVDMMKLIFDKFGYHDFRNELSSAMMGDKMNWICIRSNMENMLNEVVSHSFLEGDYVFFTLSSKYGMYKVSSFKISKKTTSKNFISFSSDSYSDGDGSSFTDDTSGYTVWWYNSLKKSNNIGHSMESIYPNLIYSTYHEGKPDVGACDAPCFNKLLKATGYDNQDDIMESLGGAASYGPSILIRDYPLNTGNMYAVAPVLRDRELATYAKTVEIVIVNAIGPDVGEYVLLQCRSNDRENGQMMLDDVYSDEYVVLNKRILKSKLENKSDDIYVLLTLGSNHLLTGNAKLISDEYSKIQLPDNANKTDKIKI